MQIVQLIYASESSVEVTGSVVASILSVSSENNRRDGITGFLAYAPGRFLQVLEGPPDKVNELFERISKDSRHHNIKLLSYGMVPSRSYPHWMMGACNLEEQPGDFLLRLTGEADFRPHDLGSDAAKQVLDAAGKKAGDPGAAR